MGYEHMAERTSQIIDEFALSMGSLELQRFVERLLKIADEFNSVNGLEAVLIEIDTASSCYTYPSLISKKRSLS